MTKKTKTEQFKYPTYEGKSDGLKTVVAERGQVTIPKKIRDQLGLLPGTPVSWHLKDNRIYLTKEIDEAAMARVYGCIRDTFPYASTDEFINDIRGPVE